MSLRVQRDKVIQLNLCFDIFRFFKRAKVGKWYRVFSKPVCEAYLLMLFLRTTNIEKKERYVVGSGSGGS